MTDETDEDTLAASIREELGAGERETEEPESEAEEAEEEGSEEEGEPESEEESGEEPDEGDEPEESEEEGGEEEPERRTAGRGSARIRNLQKQLAEERRLRQEAEARSGGTTTAQPAQVDPQAAQKALTDELAKHFDQFEYKTPQQRAEIFLSAQRRVLEPVLRQFAGAVGADRDRAAFRETYANKPFYKTLAPKVEEEFQKAQAKGYFIPREQFFKQMVADLALNGVAKSGKSQKRGVEIRKAKAKGTSTTGRGDAKGGGKGASFVRNFEQTHGDKKI